MILYSIDIETTGVNPETSQILSCGIAELDTEKGLTGRTLNILFPREQIQGTPFAINMNQDLIKLQRDYLMAGTGTRGVILNLYGYDYAVMPYGMDWMKLDEVLYFEDKVFDFDAKSLTDIFAEFVKDPLNVTCLGKNFASFDLQFLKRTNIFNDVKLNSRSADPAVLFFEPSDLGLPNMQLCMDRAGVKGEVTHNALQDAIDTANVYMEGLKRLHKR